MAVGQGFAQTAAAATIMPPGCRLAAANSYGKFRMRVVLGIAMLPGSHVYPQVESGFGSRKFLAICAYTMVVKKAVSKCSWKPREDCAGTMRSSGCGMWLKGYRVYTDSMCKKSTVCMKR